MPNVNLNTLSSRRRNPEEYSFKKNYNLKIKRVGNSVEVASGITLQPGYKAVAITCLLLISQIKPTDAMENGRLPKKGGDDYSPLVRFMREDRTGAACSSTKLNERQLLTAKHCAHSGTTPQVKNSAGLFQNATAILKHPVSDLAIISFPSSIEGENKCMPIMTKKTFLKTKTKHHACGLKGNMLISGRGKTSESQESNRERKLKTGLFILKDEQETGKVHYSGALDTEAGGKARERPGDSGGTVLACNTDTGKFELAGILKGSYRNDDSGAFVVDIVSDERRDWITNNSNPCTGSEILGEDIYPSSSHNRQNSPPPGTCIIRSYFRSEDGGDYIMTLNTCSKKVNIRLSSLCDSNKKSITLEPKEMKITLLSEMRCANTNDINFKVRYAPLK